MMIGCPCGIWETSNDSINQPILERNEPIQLIEDQNDSIPRRNQVNGGRSQDFSSKTSYHYEKKLKRGAKKDETYDTRS